MTDMVRAAGSDVPALAAVLADAYAEDRVRSWLMPQDRYRRLRLLIARSCLRWASGAADTAVICR